MNNINFDDINMDTVLAQILSLHDTLLALEDRNLSQMQRDSVDTMQGLSSRLCTMWVTNNELAQMSTDEKSILRHDFMNPLHGIIGFTTLIMREPLPHPVAQQIQETRTQAKAIERNMILLTKGYLPEVVE